MTPPQRHRRKLRAVVRVEGAWQDAPLPEDPEALCLWCMDHDGQEAVIIDDATKTYYCGRLEEIEAYREKGKAADSFYPVAKGAFDRIEGKPKVLFQGPRIALQPDFPKNAGGSKG